MSQNAPREKPHATRAARGKVPPPLPGGIVPLGRFRGTLRAGAPREAPRVTDFAAYGAEGDGFGAESVALAGFRGSGGRGMPAARVVSS